MEASDSSTKVAAYKKLKQHYNKASAQSNITKFNFYILKKVLNKEVIN